MSSCYRPPATPHPQAPGPPPQPWRRQASSVSSSAQLPFRRFLATVTGGGSGSCGAEAPSRPGRPSGFTQGAGLSSARMDVCYRHPDRETGVSCSSCGRPICPDCMTTTPVGMRCPECARERTPIQSLGPASETPRVTYVLIGINVAVALASLVARGGDGVGLTD